MLHPAPTTRISPSLARGVLEAVVPASGPLPAHIVVGFPNTNYQTHLLPTETITGGIGSRLIGTIRADARRVDVVDTGGKYVEPVYGRPRRVQGRVVSCNDLTRTLLVDAGMPIHLRLLDERQHAGDFTPGELVSCDVLDGATFTPR
jgi:hypothetical protein